MLWQPGEWPLPASRAEWLALSAGVAFAASNVISRHLDGVTEGAKAVTVWAGVVVLTLIGWRSSRLNSISWQMPECRPGCCCSAVGLAIGSMTYAVQYGLARVPANQAIVIFLFELVVAAVAAYFLSDERMGVQEWMVAAVIITASLFSGHMKTTRTRISAIMADITALLHAGLLVSDLARAKTFYESVLGWRCTRIAPTCLTRGVVRPRRRPSNCT